MKRILIGIAAIAAIACIPHTASAQDSADLTLVHGIPGTTVDLTVDGTVVIDGFVPGSLANISSFAGQTLQNVTVTDDATGTVVIGPVASLVVPASGSHSIVAHLDAGGTAVLSTFENNTETTSSGEARLTLRHTAKSGAIDLIVGDQRPIEGATNGQSAEIELAAGTFTDAQDSRQRAEVAIAEIATLDLAANTNTIVYAVGSVEDDTLDFVVQIVDFAVASTTTTTVAGSTTTTSAVPTAVNTGSPIGGTSTTTLVVVALGGLVLAGGAMLARRRV